MVSPPDGQVDLGAGKMLWELGAVTCRILTHPTPPHFEVRLVVVDGVIAREWFHTEVAAGVYAAEQMRVFGMG